eukprot:m.29641 g.29641  ORF g.29641 m.29641 type:complete len:63 (+) comp10541_c0_seq4:3511-3699(+)
MKTEAREAKRAEETKNEKQRRICVEQTDENKQNISVSRPVPVVFMASLYSAPPSLPLFLLIF